MLRNVLMPQAVCRLGVAGVAGAKLTGKPFKKKSRLIFRRGDESVLIRGHENTHFLFRVIGRLDVRGRSLVARRSTTAARAGRRAGLAAAIVRCAVRSGCTSDTSPSGPGPVLCTAPRSLFNSADLFSAAGRCDGGARTAISICLSATTVCGTGGNGAAPPMVSSEWKATVDALFLERSSGGSILLGQSYVNSGTQPLVANLYSDDMYFPLEPGLRLEISRKFNDNITLAATYWGLQQWSVNETIYGGSVAAGNVVASSPFMQLPSFDNSLGYTYGSQVQNVELNALIRLNPSDPYWEVDWLWGARYVYLADNLSLTGVNDASGTTEWLNSNTTNNLLGVQTGLLFVHGWSRFQWEAGLKFGLMANMYRQHYTDTAADSSGVPTGFTLYNVSNNACGLSALFEVSVAACYRLTDNLGLRLGYQFYDFTGLALAPRQLGSFGHGGNLALDGLSIGLQANW